MKTGHFNLMGVVLVGTLALTACAEDHVKDQRAAADPSAAQAAGIGEARPIMQAKLANAEGVLEALAVEDFDKVRLHAHALYELSQAAEWHVHKTVAYERFSTMFRDNVSALIQDAMRDNLEGATLAYLQMTMTCVKCHTYMRTEGLARIDDAPLLAIMTRSPKTPSQ